MRGIKKRGISGWKRLGLFVLLFLLLVILGNSTRKVYNKKENAELALSKMHQDVVELAEREKELKESESRIKSSEGLEFELRKKFTVARPGRVSPLSSRAKTPPLDLLLPTLLGRN